MRLLRCRQFQKGLYSYRTRALVFASRCSLDSLSGHCRLYRAYKRWNTSKIQPLVSFDFPLNRKGLAWTQLVHLHSVRPLRMRKFWGVRLRGFQPTSCGSSFRQRATTWINNERVWLSRFTADPSKNKTTNNTNPEFAVVNLLVRRLSPFRRIYWTCWQATPAVSRTLRSSPRLAPWSWNRKRDSGPAPLLHLCFDHRGNLVPTAASRVPTPLRAARGPSLTWYNPWWCWVCARWWARCTPRTGPGSSTGWGRPSPGRRRPSPRPAPGCASSAARRARGTPAAADPHCGARERQSDTNWRRRRRPLDRISTLSHLRCSRYTQASAPTLNEAFVTNPPLFPAPPRLTWGSRLPRRSRGRARSAAPARSSWGGRVRALSTTCRRGTPRTGPDSSAMSPRTRPDPGNNTSLSEEVATSSRGLWHLQY